MTIKHTPGPWRHDPRGSWGYTENGAVVDADGSTVAVVTVRETVEETRANGDILGAALDLLAACEAFAENPNSHYATCPFHRRTPGICTCPYGAARAAVRKAGGSVAMTANDPDDPREDGRCDDCGGTVEHAETCPENARPPRTCLWCLAVDGDLHEAACPNACVVCRVRLDQGHEGNCPLRPGFEG